LSHSVIAARSQAGRLPSREWRAQTSMTDIEMRRVV